MRAGIFWLSVCLSICYVFSENHYVNQWAAEIPGGHEEANRVAREHGYRIVKKVQFPFFKEYFLIKHYFFRLYTTISLFFNLTNFSVWLINWRDILLWTCQPLKTLHNNFSLIMTKLQNYVVALKIGWTNREKNDSILSQDMFYDEKNTIQ